MFISALAISDEELVQILQLQQDNRRNKLSQEEKNQYGFVTLEHDLPTLRQMNRLAPTVIVKDEGKVVGYALSMLPECRNLIPDLQPMFDLLDKIEWNGKSLALYRYYVMGQVCIAKDYRGKGIFEQLFQHHKKTYSGLYELFVTEISTSNYRSLRAHQKVGFKPAFTHCDELDEWSIVVWDWS